jgi:hypothetical protein
MFRDNGSKFQWTDAAGIAGNIQAMAIPFGNGPESGQPAETRRWPGPELAGASQFNAGMTRSPIRRIESSGFS